MPESTTAHLGLDPKMSRVVGGRPLLLEGRGQDQEARRRATRRGIAPSQPDSPKGQTDASQGDSVSVSGGLEDDEFALGSNGSFGICEISPTLPQGFLEVTEKDQLNQAHDEVLRRMLHTPPQPKTGGKSLKNLGKKQGDDGLSVKPLPPLRESPSLNKANPGLP
jgi:hypothetical protein